MSVYCMHAEEPWDRAGGGSETCWTLARAADPAHIRLSIIN